MNQIIFTEEMLEKLGQRIKELRIAAGYSNAEIFAYENKISRSQYGRYERGEDIRFSTLTRIIHALHMTIPEFFSDGFES